MGINLHSIVRSAISAVARDLPADLYISTGRSERKERGNMVPIFHPPVPVTAQWQSMKNDEIVLSDAVSTSSTVRRVYVRATDTAEERPWAMWRPLGRSGDLLQDDKGNFWLVDAVIEDWSHEGWVCLQAVLQTVPPVFSVEEVTNDEGN